MIDPKLQDALCSNDKVILYHHLGLGDHLICNGLVHTIKQYVKTLFLVCKRTQLVTIKHLYEDYPNITILPVDNENIDVYDYAAKTQTPLVKIGFENVNLSHFAKSFYDQISLPFETMISEFRLPRNLEGSKYFQLGVSAALGSNYTFVHRESTAGTYDLKIDTPHPIFEAKKTDTPNALDYVITLCKAKEINFINSGLYPLVYILHRKGMLQAEKIVYHNCRSLPEGGHPIEIHSTYTVVNY